MSDERRKNLRTQGKYNDGKVQKSREKKQKNSVGAKESPEASLSKRNSEGKKSGNNSLSDESPPQLKYKENSEYTFHQFDEVKKPTEIKGSGTFILSTTDNGESKILYEPRFLYEDEGNDYYNQLLQTVNFDTRKIVIHGVEYDQPRLVAWFGPFPYSYSGVTLEAAEMPDVVLEIKNKVEAYLKSKGIEDTFNSVLINLYRDGKDSVSWHSDDEIMLGVCPTIASVSLGETRRFEMKRKSQKHDDKSPSDPGCEFVVHLTHGSLVVMTGCMQEDWQHRVPKEYHDRDSRINLTFRTVFPLEKAADYVPVKETNLATAEKSNGRNNSSASNYGFKLDDKHFPSLQKDTATTKFNVTSDMNDNTDEEKWDIEQNVENDVAYKNTCSNSNEKNNFNNEKPSEKWHNIESNYGNEKSSLDDKTTKKLWCDDYDSSLNDFQENNTTEERCDVKYNKSVNNSTNEIERNKFYEKSDFNKLCNNDSNLTVKNSQQNALSREEGSIRSFNSKTNSYVSVFHHENGTDSGEPLNTCQDAKSDPWVDSAEENNFDTKRNAKPSLNVNAKTFTNSYVTVTQENDLNSRDPPNTYQYVHSNLWECPTVNNNVELKQSTKMALNVDAKEFVPTIVKSNEFTDYSVLPLEDLISCDINLLQGDNLQDHAYYLKLQIYERFPEISRFERKDLEFLLELSDGSQTDKNQKLITKRICRIVQNNLLMNRPQSNSMSSFDRNPRQRGYDNQNYYSDKGKRFPNQNRNSKHSRGRY